MDGPLRNYERGAFWSCQLGARESHAAGAVGPRSSLRLLSYQGLGYFPHLKVEVSILRRGI